MRRARRAKPWCDDRVLLNHASARLESRGFKEMAAETAVKRHQREQGNELRPEANPARAHIV